MLPTLSILDKNTLYNLFLVKDMDIVSNCVYINVE